MISSPQPPQFESRVEAHRPISSYLLAAVSRTQTTLAERFAEVWFDAAARLIAADRVMVFDDMVIGRPSPLVLEAAHEIRTVRRAERAGEFDDEEQRWYDEHDSDDEIYDPPCLHARVLDAMSAQQEYHRLVDGGALDRAVWRAAGADRDLLWPMVRLGIAMNRLLVELADAVRIGTGVVVDARLPRERLGGWRWVA